jgi:glucose-1-phosphate adenylyltransferase
VINRAIIDKNARIGEKVIIGNDQGVNEGEGDGYYIRDGIVVIPKNAEIASGTVI